MTKYTFSLKNNNNFTSNNTCPFYNKCKKSTDYSKVLDDLIAADIKDKNPWLYGNDTITTSGNLKIKLNGFDNYDDDSLETAFIFGGENKKFTLSDAFGFLKNLAFECPFKKNITYKLTSGDYIEITDDYIHINDQIFFFNLMDEYFFANLGKKMKKTIATIYTDGLKITIKK